MAIKFFITGTDTEVGKTYISVGMLKLFNKLGYSTLGIKPIASGGSVAISDEGARVYNDDGLALQHHSSIKLDYHHINPISFQQPIAPHIAANKENFSLNLANLVNKTTYAMTYPADVQIIEGAGGWYVPLNQHETMADFVRHYQLPVILVVNIRLGCINHALLTYRAITNTNVPFAGWVANFTENKRESVENEIIETLLTWIPAPCLGIIPHQGKPEDALSIQQLGFF